VRFPIFGEVDIQGYRMYPGTDESPGLAHTFGPGLHLIAGVNGLGKSTLLLLLYHAIVGPTSIDGDNFGVPQPEVITGRLADRFRRRVPDGAREAWIHLTFKIGHDEYVVRRSIYNLALTDWRFNGATQAVDEQLYGDTVVSSMNVGGFADVLTILNHVVFMFEDRRALMWNPPIQRNVLRSLFMSPADANNFAEKAQAIATANSAYRNLLYIINRDKKQLAKDEAALASANALGAEYNSLQLAIAADVEVLQKLVERRIEADEARTDARTTLQNARSTFDDLLREIEALKLARVASAFPDATDAGKYMLARIVGDKECLSCGATGGPFVEKWAAAVIEGSCLICGAAPAQQEKIIPEVAVDSARIARAEERLSNARKALAAATAEFENRVAEFGHLQHEIDQQNAQKGGREKRVRELAGSLPPSAPQVNNLRDRLKQQDETLKTLDDDQKAAEAAFDAVFGEFSRSIQARASVIRESFARKISDFLVEKAEITLTTSRGPVGQSGRSYDWPTFELSMTSGTFDNPSPRRYANEVSMSQGEFIDLAFRLALADVAADGGPACLIFDAPEASLDALFMRRAGAFLTRFTQENDQNRLVVTSNLTNADMIPALFGAYEPLEGDPIPSPIPREQRRDRVIDLLKIAAPTSAVQLVGDRYSNYLDEALFPPKGSAKPGL
jgi:hypothetical protein